MSNNHKRPALLVPALAVALGAPFSAHATGIEVSSLGSAINANDGVTTLREAIQQANATPGTDIVTFKSELTGTIAVGEGKELPIITDDTVILGDGRITLDAGGADNVIRAGGYGEYGSSFNTSVTLSGLTLTGADESAVAMYSKYSGNLSIQESTISGNGSAVFALAKYQNTAIVDSRIVNNAGGEKYGGVFQYSEAGSLSIQDSTISGNGGAGVVHIGSYSELDGPGGGSRLLISGSTITNNQGTGAAAAGTRVEIDNSVISGNTASNDRMMRAIDGEVSYGEGASAGGVALENAYAEIGNSTISNNTAGNNGGGIYANDSRVTLRNVTLSGNTATTGSGGGIFFETGQDRDLDIRSSKISGNQSSQNGAGVFVEIDDKYAGVDIEDSEISGNTITAKGQGAGLYASIEGDSYYGLRTQVEVSNSRIFGNVATDGQGGGIDLDLEDTIASISDSIIEENSAGGDGSGGGLAMEAISSEITLSGSTVSGNTTSGDGGGVSADLQQAGSSLEITGSTLADNSADGYGGGVALDFYYADTDAFTLTGSTVSGNAAGAMGGGIAASIYYYQSGAIQTTNSTLSGNSAAGGGGAIAMLGEDEYYGALSVELIGTTVFGNTTTGSNPSSLERAQVVLTDAYEATVTLEHSVVSGNAADEDIGVNPGYGFVGTAITASHSLVGSYSYTGEGSSVSFDEASTSLSAGDPDPMLGELANNGGPTLTHLPLDGSPLIDGGASTAVASLDGEDQRGASRDDEGSPMGGYLDIGAVEITVGNSSPVFTGDIGRALRGVVGREVNISVGDYVVDADGDTISYTFTGLPDDLDFSDGSITGTLELAGTYLVTATADDGISAPTVVQSEVRVLQEAKADTIVQDDDDDDFLGGLTPAWLLALAGLVGLRRRRR